MSTNKCLFMGGSAGIAAVGAAAAAAWAWAGAAAFVVFAAGVGLPFSVAWGSFEHCKQTCWQAQLLRKDPDLQTGLLRGRGVHLVGKLAFGMAAVVALGKGAHSQSIALCERLKQYLHRSAFAWPVKAMFH